MTDQAVPSLGRADPVTDELQAIKGRAHQARLEYERTRGLYHDFANDIARLIRACLDDADINYHTITGRAKDPDSFEKKAAQTSPDDPSVAKYTDPIQQITDKAAVRVTTYFLETVDLVLEVIDREFDVIEHLDKTSPEPDRLGYQSHHFLVRYVPSRTILAEYRRFSGLIAEIQVRTILQHAWAEIEHDIQYKAIAAVPELIRRRFTSLAGLIEIADREFQAIANENLAIKAQALEDIDAGQLDQVEITRDSFKEYIDKKFGPDGRMREVSYDYAVRLLLALGFTKLSEVDECIDDYDDDAVGRAISGGTRPGQLTRFEYVLLAGMGEYYILAHPATQRSGATLYTRYQKFMLNKIRDLDMEVGSYRPSAYPSTRLSLTDLAALEPEDYFYTLPEAIETSPDVPGNTANPALSADADHPALPPSSSQAPEYRASCAFLVGADDGNRTRTVGLGTGLSYIASQNFAGQPISFVAPRVTAGYPF